MLDSVIRLNKKYYPQTLLEECKYVMRNKKIENLINDDLDLSSSDQSDNCSDNGDDNESVSETENINLILIVIMGVIMNLIVRQRINFDIDESSD